MKRFLSNFPKATLIIFYSFFIILSFFSISPLSAGEINVALAANMQFAFEEIKALYEKETGTKVHSVISSSGKLTAQIENGAPHHIFISADMKYPDILFKNGLALREPHVYAYGTLVLWTLNQWDLGEGLKILTRDSLRTIAVADPKAAPYGAAAVEALKRSGIYEKAKDKLIFGQSISQVNQYITSQGADIGFTAKSVVLSPELAAKGTWITIDEALYDPMPQGCVLLKYAKENNLKEAESFYQYLFSKEARSILQKYGYNLP